MPPIAINFTTDELKHGDVVHLKDDRCPGAKYRYGSVTAIARKETSNEILTIKIQGLETLEHIDNFEPFRYNSFRVGDEVRISDLAIEHRGVTGLMKHYEGKTSKITQICVETNCTEPSVFYHLEVDNSSYWWHQEHLKSQVLVDFDCPYEIKVDKSCFIDKSCLDYLDYYLRAKDKNNVSQLITTNNNENQLQREKGSVRGADKPTGHSVCCRRSKASVTSGYLSHKAILG